MGEALRHDSGPRLVGAVAPASGKFGDGLLFETTFSRAAGSRVAAGLLRRGKGAGDAYFAVHASDLSGGPSEYNYSLKVVLTKGVLFSMKEPAVPDGVELPLASVDIDGPAYAIYGALIGPRTPTTSSSLPRGTVASSSRPPPLERWDLSNVAILPSATTQERPTARRSCQGASGRRRPR